MKGVPCPQRNGLNEKQAFLFFFFFWPCHVVCGILVPWPGIEPGPQQWKHWVLTTGPPGNSPNRPFLKRKNVYNILGWDKANTVCVYLHRSKGKNFEFLWVMVIDCPSKQHENAMRKILFRALHLKNREASNSILKF